MYNFTAKNGLFSNFNHKKYKYSFDNNSVGIINHFIWYQFGFDDLEKTKAVDFHTVFIWILLKWNVFQYPDPTEFKTIITVYTVPCHEVVYRKSIQQVGLILIYLHRGRMVM